jgi:hypothetical protein
VAGAASAKHALWFGAQPALRPNGPEKARSARFCAGPSTGAARSGAKPRVHAPPSLWLGFFWGTHFERERREESVPGIRSDLLDCFRIHAAAHHRGSCKHMG